MTERDEHGRSGAQWSPDDLDAVAPRSRAAARRALRGGEQGPSFRAAPAGAAPRQPPLAATPPALSPPQARPAPSLMPVAISVAGVLIAVLALALVLWRSPAPAPSAERPSPAVRRSDLPVQADSAPTTASTPSVSAPTPPSRVVIGGVDAPKPGAAPDPSGLQRVFREVVARAEQDPEGAQARFDSGLVALGDSWPRFERPTITASVDEAVRAIGALARQVDAPEAVLDAVERDAVRLSTASRVIAHEVWRIAFAVGLSARLAHEPELPASIRERARGVAAAALGDAPAASGAFWAGASGALQRMPRLLVGIPDAGDAGAENAWRRWLDAVECAMWDAPRTREATLLDAAGALLEHASAREPDVATRSIIGRVLDGVDFSSAGGGRKALIRWLDDTETIATRELAATIQHIARQRSSAGLEGVVLLSSAANDDERGRFRDLVSSRWALATPAFEASIRARWRNALASIDAGSSGGDDADAARFERASRLAWISAAAAAVWRADAQGAALALSRQERLTFDTSPPASSLTLTSPIAPVEGDGRWATRYLAARRNAAERQRVVLELASSSTPLGPIDSEVLAEAALLGAPSNVRDAAGRAVERRAGDPTMAAALLELLPRSPRTIAAGRLYTRAAAEQLPPVRDTEWPREARRALVSRVLRAISSDLAPGSGDLAARELAEAYSTWSSAGAQATSPDEAARTARAALRREALVDGSSGGHARLDEVDRRLIARRALATGPVQAFVAEQAGLVETLALLAAQEGSSRAQRVQAVVDRYAAERRDAATAAEQIEAGERAMAALWSIRLGVEAAP